MQYKTHLAASLAISLPVMAATETLGAGAIAAVSLGALLPDIDEPHSWIGRRTRGISDIINKAFGHRGITHSLVAVGTITLIMTVLAVTLSFPPVIAGYFILGYLLHLIEDSFSKSGVAWLQPFSGRNFQSGFGVVYYTTGKAVESFLFLLLMIVLLFQIKTLDFSPAVASVTEQLSQVKGIVTEKLEAGLSGILILNTD